MDKEIDLLGKQLAQIELEYKEEKRIRNNVIILIIIISIIPIIILVFAGMSIVNLVYCSPFLLIIIPFIDVPIKANKRMKYLIELQAKCINKGIGDYSERKRRENLFKCEE